MEGSGSGTVSNGSDCGLGWLKLWFGAVRLRHGGARMIWAAHLVFGPFRLDPVKKRLWRGEEELVLRPMAVSVLQALVEHAGEVVPKEDLLKWVWAGTYVTKTALKVCVREIRKTLGDEATTPRFVETVGQQGYRFVGYI